MLLTPLATQDDRAIDSLLDAAFGSDRRTRTAYAIRIGMAWLTGLSFAALAGEGGPMLGLIQCWPVALGPADVGETPLVMVGPVAVLPAHQEKGLGRAMMDHLIAAVDAAPADPLVMIGDPEYYGRFWGFTAEGTAGWDVPGPVDRRRLLVRRTPGHEKPLPAVGLLGPRHAAPARAIA